MPRIFRKFTSKFAFSFLFFSLQTGLEAAYGTRNEFRIKNIAKYLRQQFMEQSIITNITKI